MSDLFPAIIKKRKTLFALVSVWIFCFAISSVYCQENISFSIKPLGEFLPDTAVYSAGSCGNYFYVEGGNIYFFASDIWLSSQDKKQVEGVCDSSFSICSATAAYSLNGKCSFNKDENNWPLPVISPDFKEYSGIRKYRIRQPFRAKKGIYFFYSLMNNYGPGLYDYFRVGQGLAFSEKISGPYSKLKYNGSNFWFSDVEPAFGEAVIESGGKFYIYGNNPGALYKNGAVLAAVSEKDLTDKSKWLYYTEDYEDKKWTPDLPEASVVIEGAEDEFSVSYNAYLKKYIAIFFSQTLNKVLMKTSNQPWGPWEQVYEIKKCLKEEYCRAAKEAPALSMEGGRKIFIILEKKHMPYLYEINFS